MKSDDRVYLELPIKKEFARLLRLIVSGIAARMDFDLDSVDDLKIAVEEAFLMSMRHKVDGPIAVTFRPSAGRLEVEFAGNIGPEDKEEPGDDFGNFIMEAVVDELKHDISEGKFGLHFVKIV